MGRWDPGSRGVVGRGPGASLADSFRPWFGDSVRRFSSAVQFGCSVRRLSSAIEFDGSVRRIKRPSVTHPLASQFATEAGATCPSGWPRGAPAGRRTRRHHAVAPRRSRGAGEAWFVSERLLDRSVSGPLRATRASPRRLDRLAADPRRDRRRPRDRSNVARRCVALFRSMGRPGEKSTPSRLPGRPSRRRSSASVGRGQRDHLRHRVSRSV